MNKCTMTEKKLSMFVDKELSVREYEKIQEHLVRCPKCRNTVDMFSKIDSDVKIFLKTMTNGIKPYKLPDVKVPESHNVSMMGSTFTDFAGISLGSGFDVALSTGFKLINIAFIILGFLLLLATPIHGS